MPMKECVCVQCRENDSRVEYFQCEGCQLFGTVDDFPSAGDELCHDCAAAAATPRYAVEADACGYGYWVIDTTVDDGERCNVGGAWTREEAEAMARVLNANGGLPKVGAK